MNFNPEAWSAVGIVITATVVPIGSLAVYLHGCARTKRDLIINRIDVLHECVERFRNDMSEKYGRLDVRVSHLENTAAQRRRGDFNGHG